MTAKEPRFKPLSLEEPEEVQTGMHAKNQLIFAIAGTLFSCLWMYNPLAILLVPVTWVYIFYLARRYPTQFRITRYACAGVCLLSVLAYVMVRFVFAP